MGSSRLILPLVSGMILLSAPPMGREANPLPAPRKPAVHRPNYEDVRFLQAGRASWYGEPYHGRLTASGETFNMFLLTAAHRDLPLGTQVRVTHLRSRRSVVVRINDRGPLPEQNIIDVSYAAARELGFVQQGLSRVRLDVVRPSRAQRKPALPADDGG